MTFTPLTYTAIVRTTRLQVKQNPRAPSVVAAAFLTLLVGPF